VSEEEAQDAAAGWGGDSYQVFYNEEEQATLLVAQWKWDTSQDGEDFFATFRRYQNERFRGVRAEEMEGECWSVDIEISCIYPADGQTLWILAPTKEIIQDVRELHPQY
jgi:hypothetical protein